jgi:hypothetical protein
MVGVLLTVSAGFDESFSKSQSKAASSTSDDEDAVIKLSDGSAQLDNKMLAERHTSNSRKRWDGFVSAAEGNLCAIAEIPLVISLLGEAVNTGLTSTLDNLFSELVDVVAVNFLAPVLAMQEAGHANRLPCRRREVGNAVDTLAIVCYVELRLMMWKIATSHSNKRLQERKPEWHVSRAEQLW